MFTVVAVEDAFSELEDELSSLEDELSSLEVELSSIDDEAVSVVVLSDLAQEFIFRVKNKNIRIRKITSFRFEIFFNEKEMRMLSIPNAVNIISNFGIIERS